MCPWERAVSNGLKVCWCALSITRSRSKSLGNFCVLMRYSICIVLLTGWTGIKMGTSHPWNSSTFSEIMELQTLTRLTAILWSSTSIVMLTESYTTQTFARCSYPALTVPWGPHVPRELPSDVILQSFWASTLNRIWLDFSKWKLIFITLLKNWDSNWVARLTTVTMLSSTSLIRPKLDSLTSLHLWAFSNKWVSKR